ncbi:hypothetical protein [Rhizobium sp. Leaf384]|uniref:hypothetical protein n=1 Tax=Rhizobium sp. Leaf384 TaxID=1736358 RepID=UPI0012E8048E|nr:hypothetical protein [Rhizobium sp. Leaf384]
MKSSLRQLHATPADLLASHAPWDVVSTKQLALLLKIDPATLTVWRWRGVGPSIAEGSSETRPRYLISDVVAWLYSKSGTDVAPGRITRTYLEKNGFHDAATYSDEQVARLVLTISQL